ncbi:MAG: DUF2845 domain-containing protein [Deltaproteobacteria bacterium]|nr:DUF2845 domain-containing protein [Deltaproteobacteria bacterium]TLN01240.1 MAG: DUF2845 domain-containing protein [bacterium]
MKTAFKIILAAVVILTVQTAGHATSTDTMICTGGIISIGDTAGEVLSKCGQPATSTTREEKRYGSGSTYGHGRAYTTVAIDDWIFNFGPNQFQYQLVLENGRVARIESLDYGY